MPKALPRCNATKGLNGRFRRIFPSKSSLSSRILEMAVGEAGERYIPSLLVEKFWGRGAGDNGPNGRHGDAGQFRCLRERLKAAVGYRTQNLIVVAAGNDGFADEHAPHLP